MKSGHERQKAYRDRQADKARKSDRRKASLDAIIARLDGNEKPLAVELRKLAMDGLA